MEKNMIRLLLASTTLLFMVMLVSAESVSARTGGTFDPVLTGTDTGLNAPAFLLPNIWLDGNNNNQGGNDNNQGGNGNDNGPNPVPEPSTMLSFGAALLIGGGVLYSLRLRRNRK
jgi:hypothetical protein